MNTRLSDFALPDLTFSAHRKLPESLQEVWEAMHEKNPRKALDLGRILRLQNSIDSLENRAALLVALAAAELCLGNVLQAKLLAEESLACCKTQWSANRIIHASLCLSRKYEAAYEFLSSLDMTGERPYWDEPITSEQYHLAAASVAWHIKNWDGVASHLKHACSDDITSMPEHLLEDVFRLAFYRNRADDALEAGILLIRKRSIGDADALIQTMIQQGWMSQALVLYRLLYASAPDNPLLRRRLVGLCIRTGELDEARRLASFGALDIAA